MDLIKYYPKVNYLLQDMISELTTHSGSIFFHHGLVTYDRYNLMEYKIQVKDDSRNISYSMLNDMIHNKNEPAIRETLDFDPFFDLEIWFNRGHVHRDDGPAYLLTSADQKIKIFSYYGLVHNQSGYAWIESSQDQKILLEVHHGKIIRGTINTELTSCLINNQEMIGSTFCIKNEFHQYCNSCYHIPSLDELLCKELNLIELIITCK